MLFLTRFSGAIISALTIFLLTRILTPLEYGKFSIFITSASLISVILFQWISVVITRFLTQNPKFIIEFAYKNFIYLSVIVLFTTLLFSFIRSSYEIFFMALAGSSLGLFTIKSQIANSLENFKNYNLMMLFKYMTTFLITISLSLFFNNADYIIYFFSFGAIMPIILIKIGNIKWGSQKKIIDNLYSYGIPFTIISISTLILDFSDRYIINYFLGYEKLAHYSANYDLTQQVIGGILSVFSLYFMPKIISHKNNTENTSEVILKKNYLYFSILIGTFVVFNFLIFYPFLSNIMEVKYRYSDLAQILFISLGILCGNLKGTIFDLELQLQGRIKLLILNISFMSILNIVLNILLVPHFDQLGAAFATFFSFSFGLAISIFFSKDTFNINNKNFFINIIELVIIFFLLIYIDIKIKSEVSNFLTLVIIKIILNIILLLIIYAFNFLNFKTALSPLINKISLGKK